MRDDELRTISAERPSGALSLAEWTLGGLGVAGLAGFAVTFVLVVNHTFADSQAAAPVAARTVERAGTVGAAVDMPVRGEPGPRGERGPAGTQGPPGDPGIRILRYDCVGGNCTLKCEDDEVLLTAHCGIGRTPAVYSSENSALCRSRGTAKVQIVAACVKAAQR
jgi:hypothetical protein